MCIRDRDSFSDAHFYMRWIVGTLLYSWNQEVKYGGPAGEVHTTVFWYSKKDQLLVKKKQWILYTTLNSWAILERPIGPKDAKFLSAVSCFFTITLGPALLMLRKQIWKNFTGQLGRSLFPVVQIYSDFLLSGISLRHFTLFLTLRRVPLVISVGQTAYAGF